MQSILKNDDGSVCSKITCEEDAANGEDKCKDDVDEPEKHFETIAK